MGFATEDGTHEGWVAARFADGAIHTSSRFGEYDASHVADGSDGEDWRPAAAVVGWIGACTCGWRSLPWTRVATRAEEDVTARRAYGSYLWIDGEAVTDFDPATAAGPVLFDEDLAVVHDAVFAEWQQHVEPDRLLAMITDLTERRRELDERLAATVARARTVGATWDDIGRAAGITRQSAHERWSRIAATAGGVR